MNKEMLTMISIRIEERSDYRAVEELIREAFWNVHEPGCTEHFVMHEMRRHRDFIPELSFIAVYEGRPVGHIAYTRGIIAGYDGSSKEVLCFGPISVHPDFQRMGIGGRLIEESAKKAAGLGYEAVCIYGDPRYYRKHRFECSEKYDIQTEDGMYAVPLLVRELKEGGLKSLSGRFCESKAFEVNMEEFEAFETQFPPKVKGERESQKEFQMLVSLRFPAESNTPQQVKKRLRSRILGIRDHIPEEQRMYKNSKILEQLLAAEAFLRAETVFTFVSWRSEADTYGILKNAWRMGKRTAVPKVEGKEIQFYEVTELSQLTPGAWKIPEPDTSQCRLVTPSKRDFMVLPGAVFDEKCGRIGYGGGFYDRYLEAYPDVPNAAVAFEEQIVAEVPSEAYDIRPKMVITDTRILWRA